ncbi:MULTISPECIES: D-alanyl-D-alanine carboxypeptidase [unclassified Streptomyces]|uniref:D-alanyl-D-alanine carboxypeptidase n=1 Tax=unclassified Streptomyces TaxID=2593676 RepID=UPI00380CC91E
MAGESPDRSKQLESSAEPTSGSAAAVPEARDPRIAVARDAGTASSSPTESAAASSPRGGVDTATRVFSVPKRTTEEPEAEAKADAEPEDGPDADGTTDGESGAEAESGADADAEAAPEDRVERAEGGQDGAEGAGGGVRASGAPEEPEEGATAAEGPEGAAERAEAAEDDAEAPVAAAEEPAETAETATTTAADTTAGADEPTEPSDEPEAEAEAESAPEAGTAPAADGEDDEAERAKADAAEDSDSDTNATDADTAADADAPTGKGTAEDSKTWSLTLPKDDVPRAPAEADAEDSPGTGPDDAAPDADPGKGSAEDAPVDQPTAVFKAVRPDAPAADQATTMLKLSDLPKAKPDDAGKGAKDDADADDAKAGSGAKADAGATTAEPAKAADPDTTPDATPEPAPAERTSRFVALKPLDEKAGSRAGAPPVVGTPAEASASGVTSVVPQVGPERTTQQPLPPKPPLDLLAELTNTPPPPPTPLRTLARRVKIWTPLLILVVVVFAIAQAVRPLPATALTLTAKDTYTFEGGKVSLPWPSEGQGWMDVNGVGTMDSFGDEKPVAIGSVAKAMTAYVVLKDHELKSGQEGPAVPVDATAEKEGGYDADGESTLNTVQAGDKLTLRQAISAIMIPSANNIARLLARWDAGTEAEFIDKMNAAAKDLGMTNTTYTDASGLKETTVSTAADQVKLGNELVRMPALMEITKLPEWTDPSGQKWRNYNTLVPYNDSLGIKTGSTSKAGGNLLFAATKEAGGETVTVVGAILGQHKAPIIDTVNAVSKTALLKAQDSITSAKILKKGDVVGYVDDQLGGRTPVVVTEDVPAVGWAGLTVKLSFAASDVPHTAKAGTQVGTLTVGDGSGRAVKVPVALQRELTEPGFTDKLTRVG